MLKHFIGITKCKAYFTFSPLTSINPEGSESFTGASDFIARSVFQAKFLGQDYNPTCRAELDFAVHHSKNPN